MALALCANNLIYKENSDVRMTMVHFGFDFSLIGSVYLYEMLKEVLENTSAIKCDVVPTMTTLADRHNIKIKTFNRDVRWAISKAYKSGLLKYVPFFEMQNAIPPTKQVLTWLYNYLII